MAAKRQEREKTAGELVAERQKAEELAAKAGSLKELIASLEKEIESARKAAEAAAAATALRQSGQQPSRTAPLDPGRLSPAVAFADTKACWHGQLRAVW
ncbi:hypothetical protein V6L77_13580 [Pannonibacter sp. Pt2-lr]